MVEWQRRSLKEISLKDGKMISGSFSKATNLKTVQNDNKDDSNLNFSVA